MNALYPTEGYISFRKYLSDSMSALFGRNLLKSYNHIIGYAENISKDSTSKIIEPKNQQILSEGYTIIETMIFLVISVALFGTVTTSMTQQTNRNRFTQAVETFQNDFQGLLNDVSTGSYPSQSNFRCTPTGAGPTFPLGASEQGTNGGCIFIGKLIHFGPGAGLNDRFNVYTIVGNQTVDTLPKGRLVQTLVEARHNFLGVPGNAGVQENGHLNSNLVVTKIVDLLDPTLPKNPIGGVAIVSDFGAIANVNQAVAGNAARVTLMRITGTDLGITPPAFTALARVPASVVPISNAGLLICLRDGQNANGRRASITLGENGQHLSLRRTMDVPAGGDCP